MTTENEDVVARIWNEAAAEKKRVAERDRRAAAYPELVEALKAFCGAVPYIREASEARSLLSRLEGDTK